MNYKIIKKIHEGFESDVFIIQLDGKTYIMKRYPIIDSNFKNYKMVISREIDMSQFINKLSKNKIIFFMKTIDFKLVKCNKIFKSFTNNNFVEKKTNKCVEIIYEYKGDTLASLLKTKNLKLKDKYHMIIMIVYALDIIKKGAYVHADIHSDNITFKTNKNKVKIGSKSIEPKYIYSIIDYGFNKHSKYKDKDVIVKEYVKMNYDLLYFIRQIILQNNLLQDIFKSNLRVRKFKPSHKMEYLIEIFTNYKNIWNKIKNILIQKGKNYIRWFDTFESNQINLFYENFEEDFPTIKSRGKNYINISIPLEINILFSAYNRKQWLKINKWNKVNIPNLIPSKDIEFMILNINDNKKIINYFLEKIN